MSHRSTNLLSRDVRTDRIPLRSSFPEHLRPWLFVCSFPTTPFLVYESASAMRDDLGQFGPPFKTVG